MHFSLSYTAAGSSSEPAVGLSPIKFVHFKCLSVRNASGNVAVAAPYKSMIIIIFDLNIDNFVFFEKKSWILALQAYFDHVLCIDISIFYFLFLKLYFA